MMCYIMLYMLEWMRKEKYKIKKPRIQGLRDSACQLTSTKEIIKDYISIV